MASDSGSFGGMFWLVMIVAGIVGGVLWGMTVIPPYMANREIQAAVSQTLDSAPVTSTNDDLINRINQVLTTTKTSRYWVEADGQHSALDMALTSDMITFTHDGNRQVSADVSYSQEMWLPILKQKRVMNYAFHVDGLAH